MKLSQPINHLFNTLLLLGFVLTFQNLLLTYKNLYVSGQGDLRNRIVGTRVIELGKDPYFYHWHPNDPDTLIDPLVDPELTPSRLTITPTNFLFYLPFSHTPFTLLIKYWYLTQWICLLLTLLLLLTATSNFLTKKFILITALFFAGSQSWLSNLHLGQTYIIFTLLFTLSFWFYIKKHPRLSWLVLGFLISIRPTYLLSILPFFLSKKYRYVLCTLLTTTFFVFITQTLLPTKPWNKYFSSVLTYSGQPAFQLFRSFDPTITYPQTIEGLNFLGKSRAFDPKNYSLKSLSERFLHLQPNLVTLIFIWTGWLTFLTFSLSNKLKSSNPTHLFIFASLLVVTTDFFLPTPIYLYYLIQWFPLSSLIITQQLEQV